MRIGIDISQLAYSHTGVANYLQHLVEEFLQIDSQNEYILFFSSLRREFQISNFKFQISNKNVTIRRFRFPPIVLDLLWNRLHIMPVESLIGQVDVFISSDWTEPPVRKAKKATIIYDLIIYKYPEETHNQSEFNLKKLRISPNIVASQKRKLAWVKKESDIVFCISEATKKDAKEIIGLSEEKLRVLYPGV